MAQLAVRRSHNPKVVGSIPTLCIPRTIDIHTHACNVCAVDSIHTARVQKWVIHVHALYFIPLCANRESNPGHTVGNGVF